MRAKQGFYPVIMALRRVLFSSSDLTKMEEEEVTGRELGAAREEISWATLNMIWLEGLPALVNSGMNRVPDLLVLSNSMLSDCSSDMAWFSSPCNRECMELC